jgi:HlyD family secretion protein
LNQRSAPISRFGPKVGQRFGQRYAQVSLVAIAILATIAAAVVLSFLFRRGTHTGATSQPDQFVAKRGGFDITIPVSGELTALKQIEIRNNLESRAVISEIVPEGTFVNAGDVLLRLNDEETRNKVRDAQDRLNMAEAALVAAQATLEIKKKTRQAELDKADLAIELAGLALKAWQEGDVNTRREQLRLAIQTAEKEYDRLKARFSESAGLLEKKFISVDEYRRDEIAMLKAESDLKIARLNSQMYEDYHFLQEKAQKESDVAQARSERERIEQQYNAEVRSAESEVNSKQYQLDSAKEKLAELQQQLEHCTVRAPQAGLVVYYSSTQSGGMGRNEGKPPQVGTELTRNEQVIILPDTSQMAASVKISEALVGQIAPGQRATVTPDAMPNRPMSGQVLSVGVLAESGGWRDPNRRDYTVKILLDEGNELGLKPAMRCKATIYVGRVDNALHVPIQAVFRSGPVAYVYVPQGSGFAQRKVEVGRSSELLIEVKDGLLEGERVLLRQPQASEVLARIELPRGGGGEGPGQLAQERSKGQAEDASGGEGAMTANPMGRQTEGAGPNGSRQERGGGSGRRQGLPRDAGTERSTPPNTK